MLEIYEIGKALNFSPLQHKAYLMANLEMLRASQGSSLDNIEQEVLFHDAVITPTFFSMMFDMVKVKDDKFSKILKTLSRSCKLMNHNPPFLVEKFFDSEEFFQLFLNINKIIAELWMLRKHQPTQMMEWKMKLRQIFQFRSKLLRFLETRFGQDQVQCLMERAEGKREKVRPLD